MDLYVTVAQLKAHLRIDSDSEDLLLAQYIESAQEEAETRPMSTCVQNGAFRFENITKD